MFIYWLLLLIPLLAAIAPPSSWGPKQVARPMGLGFQLYFVFLVSVIGWRHSVGGDWVNYLEPVELALSQDLSEALSLPGDIAYNTFAWLSAHAGAGVYGVNLLCALIFSYGLMVFCHNSPQPWLSLAVAVPYLVIVVAMGYTRQGVAIGLVMLALNALDNGSKIKFVAWVVIASLFHKTAVILIPVAIFSGRKSWVALIGVLLTAVLMFFLILAEFVDKFIAGYITDQFESSGAVIRITMNALPAAVFLFFRRRFDLTHAQRTFWTWMSLGALAFIGLLAVSPSSTAVDRVALYWIPLQMYVWSRWPVAMVKKSKTQIPWVVGVLLYSFAVQFVWLLFADHSFAWLPYQFYPWVWIWQ